MTKIAEPTWVAGTVNFADCPLRTWQRYSLAVEPGAEPAAPHLAIEVLVGRRHHPLLMLVAGIHGDEYDGILALGKLARELDPETLDGTVVIVPVANPFAFAAGQRRTPEDDTDLNRVFPGRTNGTLSERLADRLCQGLLRQADLIALENLPGRFQRAMADFGVPVIEGEVGGRGATRIENVAYYQERARSLICHAGLLPPPVPSEPLAAQTIWLLGSVEAETAGIFFRDAELNARVEVGDLLGRIVDSTGTIESEVRAPRAGKIGGYRDHAGVRAGDTLFNLWLPTDQSRLEEPA